MIAFLLGVWKMYGAALLKWGAIVLAVLGAFLYIRNTGRLVERAENYEAATKAAHKRREIEQDTRGMSREQHDAWLQEHGYYRD